ncbi:glycoside hydrolase family 35 protein [Heterobasidion irregulare TC 32-1]|uniref:beta-galactosidase n=1 Tax=Heterobasidion irregulare (strain TC 32-1) TaxID=747525 RepID=W4K1S5_HETIT|nr:glycoside hydrolase family 35 protein [Heterobasidion irregulare TC 32-1]ETW79762.1 glycoside hydrolase family 35 protein [Heterobasidion irregulare TC 32-1]
MLRNSTTPLRTVHTKSHLNSVLGFPFSFAHLFHRRAFSGDDDVRRDNCSLVLQGQRFLIYSGEFHTYRLAVPSLWPDILQKIKAAGSNAISVYLHWGAINPAPGVIDFDEYRAVELLYEAAKPLGYGLYINVERSAGGIAYWVTSEIAGPLRINAVDFRASWQDYIQGIIEQTARYQITEGKPVISNEYTQNAVTGAYFSELEAAYHNSSIVVPLTYNDPGEYSTDACGPTAPGYENCRQLTGAAFESVFYRTPWASNAKLMGFYTLYECGAIPFPGVYTSHDYGGAIAENHALTDKYTELKLQGLFLRSSPEFYKTDRIGNSTGVVSVFDSAAFAVLLRNLDTPSGYWFGRQTKSTSTVITNFNMTIDTSAGTLQIPQVASGVTLSSHQSKVIIGDYVFGTHSSLLYSTASILFAGTIRSWDVLFLYGDADQEDSPYVSFTTAASDNQSIVCFSPGISGLVTVFDSLSLVLYADTVTAGTFWAHALAGTDPHANYWQIGTNSTLLVGGPHLVRNASLSASDTLALRGDLNSSVRLTVIGPPEVETVMWNGEPVDPDMDAALRLTSVGAFSGQHVLKSVGREIETPMLEDWKFATSLPEVDVGFDDSAGTVMIHTATNNPFKPFYGDGKVLYGCDYGFCEDIVLWRGHFDGTVNVKSANLSTNSGEAFAASVWLNDHIIGIWKPKYLGGTDDLFVFPNGTVLIGQDNVITIVQDNMGLNQTRNSPENFKSPRGIRGFKLNNSTFSDWKVQGKVRGYASFQDTTRGIMNECGLFGERKGWHLPGFDTSSWASRGFSSGLPNDSAGVRFFVTTFDLRVLDGFDVPMSFNFDLTPAPYRTFLFINRWMMGKFVANLGPQWKFSVHEAILEYLEYQGTDTVAVALWAMESVPISPRLNITIDSVLNGGVGNVVANNPPWGSRGRL